MKKNRIIITLLILTAVLSSLSAATLDEILSSAKAGSLSYQNMLLTYQNGLLSIRELEESDKVGVNVSATVNPLLAYGTDSYGLGASRETADLTGDEQTDSYGLSVSPKVTVTLPNDGKTTISAGGSLTTRYRSGETDGSGSLGVSHTFDFSGYSDDTSENLNYTSTKYSTERTRRMNELNFEKTVLSTISSILSAQSSLADAEFRLEKQQTAYDKLVALKTYSETSSVYMNTLNTLNSLKSSLEASKEQYNQLLMQYKTLTGLDWDTVEGLEAPSLTLTTYENGNTEVLIQSLNAESSEETYKKTVALANPSSLKASLDASLTSDLTFSVSGSAQYTAKNWNVSVSPSVNVTKSGKATPSLTITGSWSNDTSSSDKEISKALNNAQSAANSYLETLSEYQQNAAGYALKILEWKSKLSQAETALEYKKTLLENTQALYDLGLETEENLKSAELDYSSSQTDYTLTIIEGLSLERDLAIFAL